jgi:hypothetical protein
MADKRTEKLPPIWGDNSNLRMTGDNCPPTDEKALLERAEANRSARRKETHKLIKFFLDRYSGRD